MFDLLLTVSVIGKILLVSTYMNHPQNGLYGYTNEINDLDITTVILMLLILNDNQLLRV